MVVLAALLNALKLTGKKIEEIEVVTSGAGAAGIAIIRLLMAMGLAVVTGTASIDFAKKGRAIRELCQEQGLSESDVEELGIL
mgnify:CR=1 FL=1